MVKLTPRLVSLFSIASTVFAASTACAQSAYPDKPIRLVIGFAAGGPTDLPGRFIADKVGNALGQRMVVENKAGAGGQIATQDVLSRPRDGYTLLLCTHFESINAAVYKKIGYKLADVAPISQISRYYYGIAMTNEVPARDWDSFIPYAKANPGKLNYGMIGRGSAQEFLALELGKLSGINTTGIPYKNGTDVINDLVAGRIHLYMSPTLAVMPLYKGGKIKVLAVSSPERLAVAPEIPTLVEKGLPFVRFGWLGICAGSGTPPAIIAQLNRQVAAAVKLPEYRDMIEKAGSIPLSSTPEELAKVLAETYEQTVAISKEFGLQLD
ncbi:MAG: Bug family tripartite tricarboxylate transporter substrate binding protein [Burkholderiales bacterium]